MANSLLDICQVNVRSLNEDKVNAIKAEFLLDYDIICLTETNLPYARATDLTLQGFHPIQRKDRLHTTGGGVGLYAAEHLGITRKYEFELPYLEAMWVKVKAGNNVFLICVCYRPPNSGVDFWNHLQESVDLATNSGIYDIILTGDLNSHPTTRHGHLLNHFCISNNLTIHVHEPTRFTPTTATIIDQFLSNIPNCISDIKVLAPISVCDHCPIRCTLRLKHKYCLPKAYQRHIWDYKATDVANFRDQLFNADWESCFQHENIDSKCEAWTSTFLNIARNCIPNKIITVRPGDKTFFTPELRRLRRKKNRVHRKAVTTNKIEHWRQFRVIRNDYNNRIKRAKSDLEDKRVRDIGDPGIDSKTWWKLAKTFVHGEKNHSIPTLSVDGYELTSDKEKADSFNTFFLQHSNLQEPAQLPPVKSPPANRLSSITIAEGDIRDLLKCLNIKKASGPDIVSHAMLKMAGDYIVPSLTRLFNESLQSHVFPSIWKRAMFKKMIQLSEIIIVQCPYLAV